MLFYRKKTGFTLIELLVVVIIVAVLAAVGIPMLTANVQRARASEGEAGLGAIRTALRTYLSQNTTFPGAVLTLAQAGIVAPDLDGRWFNNPAYTIATTAGTINYCISANGTNSTAPDAARIQGANLLQRSMNQAGTIFDATNCAGNQLN